MSAGSPGPNLHGYQGTISTKGRTQTSNCRPAHAMGLDCSKSVCQAPSRCQAELDPEDSNEHSRQHREGIQGEISMVEGQGGQNKSKAIHSISAVLSAKRGMVQGGTGQAAKALCVRCWKQGGGGRYWDNI